MIFNDIDDLIDNQPHRALSVGEDEDRLAAFALPLVRGVEGYQRHEMATVLHNVLVVRFFGGRHVNVFEPRDQGQGHGLEIFATGAENKH